MIRAIRESFRVAYVRAVARHRLRIVQQEMRSLEYTMAIFRPWRGLTVSEATFQLGQAYGEKLREAHRLTRQIETGVVRLPGDDEGLAK